MKKFNPQLFLEKIKFTLLILAHFMATLLWTRKTICQARPFICVTRGMLISCFFAIIIWLVVQSIAPGVGDSVAVMMK